MKQTLIFTIVVSLLVLTIQAVIPIASPRITANKEKCPCGKRRDKNGRCTINIPQYCPPNTRTTTIKKACPCGMGRDRNGRCTINIRQYCPPKTRTTIIKEKCPCGLARNRYGGCTIHIPIKCPPTINIVPHVHKPNPKGSN